MFDTMFTLELLLVVFVVAGAAGFAGYLAARRQRMRRETGRDVGTADVPVGTVPGEGGDVAPRSAPQPQRREFYKSLGLETTEEMKVRIYSVDEYRDELGGAREAGPGTGFVGAIKAYRQLDDEWIDYSPQKAAHVLELPPEDYEIDEERSALLLRRLPPGLPTSARDVL